MPDRSLLPSVPLQQCFIFSTFSKGLFLKPLTLLRNGACIVWFWFWLRYAAGYAS